MEPTKKNISIKMLQSDQRGYGIGGKLTRQEWQEECLKMLSAGKESFNAWQEHLSQIAASSPESNFGRFNWEITIDESEPERIEWSSDHVDTDSFFVVDVTNHYFEGNIDLSGYVFFTGAWFGGAVFKLPSSFNNAVFKKDVYFLGGRFNSIMYFTGTVFEHNANFDYATFVDGTRFRSSEFKKEANFKCAEFKHDAYFEGAKFNDFANFQGVLFGSEANFSGNTEDKLQSFGRISFSGAHFTKQVDFSNREFKGSTSFEEFEGQPTRFDVVPLFHNCKLHQDTTFTDSIFSSPLKADKFAARAYNTLRHVMSQQQSTREEQRFLKLELDAERLMAKGGGRLLYCIYKHVADYGFSVLRPFLWLLLAPVLFGGLCYGVLTSLSHCDSLLFSPSCQIDVGLSIKTIEFTLLQSLPPLGLDKLSDPLRDELFKNQLSILTASVVIQKVLAFAGWFFVALALRNLFKMK